MLSSKDKLTELIRHLEAKNYEFAVDPALITEELKGDSDDVLDRLRLRAELIDSNKKLSKIIYRTELRLKVIINMACMVWFVSSFISLLTILHANIVNFLSLIVYLLGLNTLMFFVWLFSMIFSVKNNVNIILSVLPKTLRLRHVIRAKNEVVKSALTVYEAQIIDIETRWYLGKLGHQLWIATLSGMLLALITLFTIKHYTFSWQSTLLTTQDITNIVSWLAWLPEHVGFATPSHEQILAAKIDSYETTTASEAISSYEWANLLIGSLLLYGLIPRVFLWLMCSYLSKQKSLSIDTSLPYYQRIIARWSREVTDADDFTARVEKKAAGKNKDKVPVELKLDVRGTLVVLLEYESKVSDWYRHELLEAGGLLCFSITNFGTVYDREDLIVLLEKIGAAPLQVLLGINVFSLPDRGTLRKLDKITEISRNGFVVKLINENVDADEELFNLRMNDWQKALNEREIGFVY